MVDHVNASDHAGVEDHLRFADRSLTENADVKRITVPFLGTRGESLDSLGAIGAWYETVQGWGKRRGSLRSIHANIPGGLVDFILDEVEGGDFNISMNHTRWLRTHLKSVPGMRTPVIERLRKAHGISRKGGKGF
jgi:hypothetical protein